MVNQKDKNSKVIVFDLDGTLCYKKKPGELYADAKIKEDVVAKLKEYSEQGFYIIINTSRNMRTYDRNIGLINGNTLKTIHLWLEKNNIPFDEIYIGRPWCGKDGFYVDDRTISPDEFVSKNYQEIYKKFHSDD